MKTEAQALEIRTEPLSPNKLVSSIPAMVSLLRSWGRDSLTATFGYGCKAPIEDLWQPKEIQTEQLPAFVQHSVDAGIFLPGRCDLHIEDKKKIFEFRLCHESDMHFESVDESLADVVKTLWLHEGMTLYTSAGPKGSALPKQWKRVLPQDP